MRKQVNIAINFGKNAILLLLFPFPHAPSPLTPAANFLSPSNLKLPPLITCCSENLDFHIPSHQPFFLRTPQNLRKYSMFLKYKNTIQLLPWAAFKPRFPYLNSSSVFYEESKNILITPALCSCSFLEDGKEYTYDMEIYQVTKKLFSHSC